MAGGPDEDGGPAEVVLITGELDRRRAEALCLEIRALARECGVELAQLEVVSGTPGSADGAGAADA